MRRVRRSAVEAVERISGQSMNSSPPSASRHEYAPALPRGRDGTSPGHDTIPPRVSVSAPAARFIRCNAARPHHVPREADPLQHRDDERRCRTPTCGRVVPPAIGDDCILPAASRSENAFRLFSLVVGIAPQVSDRIHAHALLPAAVRTKTPRPGRWRRIGPHRTRSYPSPARRPIRRQSMS